MKVLLVVNFSREDAREAASEVTKYLEDNDIEVTWAPDHRKNIPYTMPDDVDLCISFGGDGTLLRAANFIQYSQVPLLGLSFGHLGFLCLSSDDDYMQTVQGVLAGEIHCSRRTTLSIQLNCEDEFGDRYTKEFFALNEVTLSPGRHGDMVEFSVNVSGNKIDTIRGDGFVVSSATGSTGYALSAGGPFVTPGFKGMICVPIAPHTILARAFLTDASDIVEISIDSDRVFERSVYVDGQPASTGHELQSMVISRGPADLLLYDKGATSFYDSVSRVFWGRR